ncbi:DUF11 domain-containing protein, partial [Pedobacter sp. HMF7647]
DVTVNALPTATITGTTVVCVGSSAPSIIFAGANGTAPYTFTYTINGGSNQTVITSSGNSVTVTQPTTTSGTYNYALVSVKDASSTSCSQAQSGNATITVNPVTAITVQPAASTTYCINTTASALSVTATGTGTLTYQWYSNSANNTTSGTAVSGATSPTYTPSTTTDGTTYYYVIVSSASCGSATSSTAAVVVNPNATITLTSSASTSNQTVFVNGVIVNITYATANAATAVVTGLPPGVSYNYNAGVLTISGNPTNTGTFTYTASATGGCTTPTATGTITVNPQTDLSIVKTSNVSNPNVGSTVVFTLTASNAGPSVATNVKVNDALPAGYSFVNASPSAAYSSGVWTIGSLANGANATLTITAVVNPTGSYTNTATISGTENDPVSSNNSSSVTPTPGATIVSIVAGGDASEPSTNSKFTIKLSAPVSNPTTVNYTVSGTATNGTDYQSITNSVTIPAGLISYDVDVKVIDDNILEPTETVAITLASAGNGVVVSSTNPSASLNILDNDAASVAINSVTVNENAGPTLFTVTLTGNVQNSFTINYSTADGSATSGSDYTATSGVITFPAGSVSGATQTISVSIINDLLSEPTESFAVNLGGATGGVTISTANGTGTINDDDVVATVTAGTNGNETGPVNGTFAVTLSHASSQATTLTYTLGGTATEGSDYTAIATKTVTIAAGATTATITIPTLNDTIVEGMETVVATLTASSNPLVKYSPASASIDITDNDVSVVTVAAT